MKTVERTVERIVELGDKIKDLNVGLSGICTQIDYHLSGCTMYGMQLKSKAGDTKVGDNLYVSDPILVSKSKKRYPVQRFEFQLGQKVQCRITNKKLYVIKQVRTLGTEAYNQYRCRIIKPKNFEEFNGVLWFEEAELKGLKGNFLKEASEIKERVKVKHNSPMHDDRRG